MMQKELPTKSDFLLTLENQLNAVLFSIGEENRLKMEQFITLTRGVMILTEILCQYTTASKKGKETAKELLSEIKNSDVVEEHYMVPMFLLRNVDWLITYVRDKEDEFTVMNIAEACIKIDSYLSGKGGKDGSEEQQNPA